MDVDHEDLTARHGLTSFPTSPIEASNGILKGAGVSTMCMSRRVSRVDMVPTSPPSFGGGRFRTRPKLESNGTRDNGFGRLVL